uniref:Ty3/gypsy retrotransposon protein n=1 Tax=Tanacetum cinerariifolium TaxID=118510 RepID=A0A699HJX5_TANCI|nr:Ty3/gypsy retrotransposon protein [Tanacetum cinerariifolium]
MTDEEDDLGAATVEEGDDADKIDKGDVYVLIDNGSMHNFIRPGVVKNYVYLSTLRRCSRDSVALEFGEGDDSFRMKNISLHQMQALLDQDKIYGVYEVHSFTKEVVAAETQAEGVTLKHPELTPLLERFESLFQDKFPISTTDEMFDELGGAVIFTKLDYVSDYFKSRCGDGSQESEIRVGLAGAYESASEEADQAAFMTLSRPLGILTGLRSENESLEELLNLHHHLDLGSASMGFRLEEYIRQCLGCQQTKYSTQATGGYLQPLPTPTAVWEEVYMDFITGLPVYKGMPVILVVVDRFSKYTHLGEPLEKSVDICDSRMVFRNGSLAQQVLVQCDVVICELVVWIMQYAQGVREVLNYGLYNEKEKTNPTKLLGQTYRPHQNKPANGLTTILASSDMLYRIEVNVTPTDDGLGHRKRTKKAPGWQNEFVMG